MNSNFIFLNKTTILNRYISKLLINYPKSERNTVTQIEDSMFSLIRQIHYYNATTNNKYRSKYIYEYIVELSLIDYYLGLGYEMKYINKKKFYSSCRMINELRKIAGSLMEKCHD